MSYQKRRVDRLNRQIRKHLTPKDEEVPIPTDPVEFFVDTLRIKPYDYQAELLEDEEPLKVIRWCRRAGKTLVMTGEDIFFAAHHPGAVIIATMPKFTQIKEIYFQGESGLHSHIERMKPKVRSQLIAEVLQTIIRFNNGAKIMAEVPEPFTIRGHGPQKLSVDEFNFFRKDRDLWLSALLPMTLTRVVYINVASTPWNKDSVYYDMCFSEDFDMFSGNIVHDNGEPKYLRIWRDVLKPHGPLDKKQVDIMRKQYRGDPWRWRREMECAFVSDESAFLPSSLIVKCQSEELRLVPFEDAFEGYLFGGWDLGRERDPGVFAVINRQSDVFSLVHCHQFPLGTPYVSQMGYIKSLTQRWQSFRSVYYDHTGTKGIDEEIEKSHFPGCVGLDYTKANKHGMAVLLKDLMMTPRHEDRGLRLEDARRRFEMPFDKDISAELNIVQWEQTPSSELYTFSHPENSHDDRFWAICMAVLAAYKAPGQVEVDTGEKPW